MISDRLTVKAQVDETDIAAVKVGQRANINLDAYSQDSFPAIVDKIAYDAQTVNNVTTYTVDVLPEQAPDYMRSGMTASVTFIVDEKNKYSLYLMKRLSPTGVPFTSWSPTRTRKKSL